MQAQLLVGFAPTPSGNLSSPSLWGPGFFDGNRGRRSHRTQWTVASSSSSAEINSGHDHYAVLGLARSATAADIKRAYRLLARKYHPDVSKHSQAGEVFKSIHCAYEVLSNEASRAQYDRALEFQEDTGRSYRGKRYHSDFEDEVRAYRWAEFRWKMQHERYWDHHNVNEKNSSFTNENESEAEEGDLDQERGPFSEVLRSIFISLLLLQTFGALLSLTFSSLMAMLDRKLDAGYKMGYIIAWVLGGRGGILLSLCLSFASWVCGKKSSSAVALVMVAVWFGSHLSRYTPLPQGALLTLLYMSIKLQVDLN
ncbi:dnaJ subfamily C member 11-like [Tripterygium wilfordii]|uniref:DnaJ subfamily C member 11-like n=1 Tax=Tripterygium wilfordii TaxID=458696 RepID=A0A7J7DS35_TRIWF|nr:dnaJ homolog subfamily B member 12 [Tripterygium wilfordii]XP_038700872.1 dnaJ homolog subfamily B member 12 [Tripterygium wilfordii]KAF5749175.1 dnaJ subfamily C member 11-like [Tripterygium wilfordii]